MILNNRNSCNYGNFEKKWSLGIAIAAIMAILLMILLTFDAHYCCNFGNSEKKKVKES